MHDIPEEDAGRRQEQTHAQAEEEERHQRVAPVSYTHLTGHVHDAGASSRGQAAVRHLAAQALLDQDQLCAGAVNTCLLYTYLP